MILSPSLFLDSPLPDIASDHTATPPPLSEESLDLSRILHTVAGHSLSALGLQLELHRRRMNEDSPLQPLDSFPQATEILDRLGDIHQPDARGIYLGPAIWSLARALPEATVHLEGFERIPLTAVEQAETLLHCAREALRSAARCGANEVWLRLRRSADWISLEAEDNGCCRGERPAHELIGLRTRIDTLHGLLRAEDRRQHGWRLVASLPRRRPDQ